MRNRTLPTRTFARCSACGPAGGMSALSSAGRAGPRGEGSLRRPPWARRSGAAGPRGGGPRRAGGGSEAAQLVASSWARPLVADRATVRRTAPRVVVAGDDDELASDAGARVARLPSLAWRTAREALAQGPVLVQVPRAGYVPSLACAR